MGKYSKEFKAEAVRMCNHDGVRATSEKLGVPIKSLYLWQRQARLERGEVPTVLRPGETLEQGFKRQGRELDELKETNYILKKAMGFMVGLYNVYPMSMTKWVLGIPIKLALCYAGLALPQGRIGQR